LVETVPPFSVPSLQEGLHRQLASPNGCVQRARDHDTIARPVRDFVVIQPVRLGIAGRSTSTGILVNAWLPSSDRSWASSAVPFESVNSIFVFVAAATAVASTRFETIWN
jgi:hypothetical protein